MKKILIFLLTIMIISPAIAEYNKAADSGAKKERKSESKNHKKKREQFEKRKYEFMNRELTKLGITEEQKAQVHELQKNHRALMVVNAKKTDESRRKLSKLQNEGADEATLEAAILEISAAQTEQLRIFVRNRTEMEKIIGKEKHKKLMKSAGRKFKQHHGERAGSKEGKKREFKPEDRD